MKELDAFDRQIIAALQENGRLSNVEIAERVNLSHSSCSRRIARMERDGVILGYRALTDRNKLGLSVRAYCGIMRDISMPWPELAEKLAQIEGVVSVVAVSGEVDLMLEVVARDMIEYSDVVLRHISETPGVNSTKSTFILKEVKSIY